MRQLILLVTIFVILLINGQEPFFALEYSIVNCEYCTVRPPIDPFVPVAILVDQRGEERIEMEHSYLKTDSVYKNFMDDSPSEIELTFSNQKTKELMRFKVKMEGCLNASLSLTRIPFQAGYFEPRLTRGCNQELAQDYEWEPVDIEE